MVSIYLIILFAIIVLIVTKKTIKTNSTINIKFIGTKTYYSGNNKGYEIILGLLIGSSPTYAEFETDDGDKFEIKISRKAINDLDSITIKDRVLKKDEFIEIPSIRTEFRTLISKEFKLGSIEIPSINKTIIVKRKEFI
jgi:hypothetical protein